MKKKIAVLFMAIVSSLSILTGCNLVTTNNVEVMSNIVATSGDIKISREELLTAYNNSGYYYTYYYQMTQEEALKRTIDELVNQKYLLKYIDASKDPRLSLDGHDLSEVVSQTWDYIDSSISPFVPEVKKELGMPLAESEKEEEKKEPEFATQKQYETKFENIDGKVYLVREKTAPALRVEREFATVDAAKTYAKTLFETYSQDVKNKAEDYEKIVWYRFLTALKTSQKYYNHKDMSNKACFEREIEKAFDINLTNKKLAKYEKITKADNGYKYDPNTNRYYLNDFMLGNMVDYYKNNFNKDYETYKSTSKDSFYNGIATASNRDDKFYFGEQSEETFITCSHILIKLSEDQINQIKAIEGKDFPEEIEKQKIAEIEANTLAFRRDLETGEVVDKDGITVAELFKQIQESLNGVYDLEKRTEIFNEYLYAYNMDSGIINAKYDYVVGTKNSSMVESFTNAVRYLHENNQPGDVYYEPVLERNSNYSGYHIVFYTGTLKNIFNSPAELKDLNTTNIYNYLGYEKTSISYNQTYFEYIFDKTIEDNFNEVSSQAIQSARDGKDIQYINGNFKDLY